ncbi:hypothetical protein BZL29_5382 [Mycobacterium kansasii]|uniref:Secreted protein n=1 Tax=Mycobacterium kansasii TaxID=1768 RepID=A0A1V3X1U5_MYCKA|nr:hypothetical protein BZL29_5382 [Mycobacterium kansasii]
MWRCPCLMLSLLGARCSCWVPGVVCAQLRGRRAIMLPAGALVYIAVPPRETSQRQGWKADWC